MVQLDLSFILTLPRSRLGWYKFLALPPIIFFSHLNHFFDEYRYPRIIFSYSVPHPVLSGADPDPRIRIHSPEEDRIRIHRKVLLNSDQEVISFIDPGGSDPKRSLSVNINDPIYYKIFTFFPPTSFFFYTGTLPVPYCKIKPVRLIMVTEQV